MRELINTFLDTTKERIKNPFIGAFIFSFIAFNWKPIFIIVFASKSIQEKINLVETKYTGLIYNLWLPIIFAIFYVLVLPYVMWFFDNISSKAVEGRKKNIVKQQLFDLKSKQELAEQESKLEDIRASYRETADLNQKIEILKNQINERDNTIEIIQVELETAQNDQKRLQNFLVKQNDSSLSESQNIGARAKDWPKRKPTPHQSDKDLDFMGQLPDLVIGKNERAKLQIPRWMKRWEMEEFNLHCEEINYKGDSTAY
jgi:hypothetical protein